MQTGLQLHLLKCYSNLQKRLVLYSPSETKFSYIVNGKKMHTKMHFPLSLVLRSSSTILCRDRSTTSFPYKGIALKTQLHILLHFCPSQLPSSCKNQIYSFSKMNLKDVHIKKIKPTKSSKI